MSECWLCSGMGLALAEQRRVPRAAVFGERTEKTCLALMAQLGRIVDAVTKGYFTHEIITVLAMYW